METKEFFDLENKKDRIYKTFLTDKTNAKYYCSYADLFFLWWEQLTGSGQMDYIEEVSFFIDNFNQLKMNGHQADCYYNRGLAYKTLAYYESVDYVTKKKSEEDFQNAVDDFSKAIGIDDSQDKYYLSRGLIYLDSEKNAEALSDFSKAVQLNGANPESYFLKARACEEIGNIDEALKNYLYALHLDDTNAKYFFQLGRLYDFYLKDYEKAYQCYTKGKEFADDPFLLDVLDGAIEEIVQLMNPEMEPEENNDNYEPEASLFGKFMNVVKSGLSEVSNEYNKKMEKIEQNKERFQYKSIDELRQIIMNSNVFEEKAAAKRLLQEMGG